MRYLQYIIYFFVFLLGGAILFSLKFSYIGSDAPYYLSVARDISSGLIPYKDIYLSYTPVVMYLNAWLFEILQDFMYSRFLFFQYIVIFAGAVILYAIAIKDINLEKQKSKLLSLFFILAVMSSDGNDITLEIYSALFVLLGMLFFFREKIFWAGFFLGLSFFSKQYGLLNFFPFFLWFLMEKNHTILKLFKMAGGALIPLLLFMVYFSGFQNIPVASLFSQLNGAEYVSYTLVSWGSITDYLIGGKVFILLLVPLILYRNIKKDRLNLLLIIGILVNLLPLLLQSFQHYYINTFPFLFILIARVWAGGNNKIVIYQAASVFLITGMFYFRIFRYSELNRAQEVVGQTLQEILPQNSEVFLNGNIRYLYLSNNYRNPVVSRKGYSYPYKPNRVAMDTMSILSNSELPGVPTKKILVNDQYLYLYLNTHKK